MKGNTVLLILMFILLCGSLFLSYTNFRQIQVLRQENTGLSFLDLLIRMGEEEVREVARERAEQEVVVTTKYRLEDRYVSYKVKEPEFIGNQVGEVVLNISVDYSGEVKSAKLRSAAGITDEELIEAIPRCNVWNRSL